MNGMNTEHFAKRLRELRNERGMSVVGLANAIDLRHGAVSFWEQGKRIPSADSIFRLARFFGVSADYLLGLTDDY